MRRLAITVALIAGALLGAASGAAAVSITPSGATTTTSAGNITFTSSSGTMECALTLRGTLAEAAEGSGTREVLEPATNAMIGTSTSGSVVGCTAGGSVVLLFGGGAWAYYANSASGSRVFIYIQHANFLITAFVFARCLYEGLVALTYDEATGRAAITAIRVLATRALSGGICPASPGLVGNLTLEAAGRGAIAFELWNRLDPDRATIEWERRPEVRKQVTFTHSGRYDVDVVVRSLQWEPAGSERDWEVERLECVIVARGGSCRIEIRPKAGARRTSLRMRGRIFTVGQVQLNP